MSALHSASIQRVLGVLGALALSALGTPTAHAAPFAVSGPCYTVPTTGSPGGEPANEGSAAAVAANFHGDLDGDGVPDRALFLIPDRPGEDVLGEYHFFVLRGTCGHWVGGMRTTMTEDPIELGPKPVNGLRPIILSQRVSRGSESQQWQYTGQVLSLASTKSCGRDADCQWHSTTERPPPVLRPALPQAKAVPGQGDPVSLLWALLKQRGFAEQADGVVSRGSLRVRRQAGSLDFAEIQLSPVKTSECPSGDDSRRLDCGPLARLAEVAEALGGCTPMVFAGQIASVQCRAGLLLQINQADRARRVTLRGGAGEPPGPFCDGFPHEASVLLEPGKSYCVLTEHATQIRRQVPTIKEWCPQSSSGNAIVTSCDGSRISFAEPQPTPVRLQLRPVATAK